MLTIVKTFLKNLPWPVWATAATFGLFVAVITWENHRLDEAEALGEARAKVAYVRDSVHRSLVAHDSADASAKRTAATTTAALSSSLRRLKNDNARLTVELMEATGLELDTTFAVHIDTVAAAALASLPDTAQVVVSMGLLRHAVQVSQDAKDLGIKYTADSVAHVTQVAGLEKNLADTRAALKREEGQPVSVPARRSWWATTKAAAGVTFKVIGVVTSVVLTVKAVR